MPVPGCECLPMFLSKARGECLDVSFYSAGRPNAEGLPPPFHRKNRMVRRCPPHILIIVFLDLALAPRTVQDIHLRLSFRDQIEEVALVPSRSGGFCHERH